MSLFRLYVNSSSGIDIDPEYDFRDSANKKDSIHRAKDGGQYRYTWGGYDKIDLSINYVNSSTKETINNWWENNTSLFFMEKGSSLVRNMFIANKSRPIDKTNKPYIDLFMGKVTLETKSSCTSTNNVAGIAIAGCAIAG